MKNFTLILSLILVFSLSACVVESDGPQGPRGPQGPPGVDGNANVISINYLVLEEDWFEVGKPGDEGFYMAVDLDVPEINQDIVDNGLVLAYYRANDTDPWTALPFTRISHNPNYVEKFDFIYNLGFVGLQSMASDRGATPYAGTVKVIVAAAIPAGKTSIDTQSFEDVSAYYELDKAPEYYRTVN